jgi:hypothetical protein
MERWVPAGASLFLVAACTSIVGLDRFGYAPDAGGDGATSVTLDASEGGRSPTLDAGDGGLADAGPWCQRNAPDATFCDDFDETPLGYGWKAAGKGGGDGGLDPDVFVSPPFGFTASTPPLDGGFAFWFLGWTGSVPSQSLQIAFDLRIDAVGDTTKMELAQIGLPGSLPPSQEGNEFFFVQLAFDEGGIFVAERLPPSDGGAPVYLAGPTLTTPMLKQWARFALRLTLQGSMGTVTVTMNGAPAGTPSSFICAQAFGIPTFQLGQDFSQAPAPGQVAHFDDVIIDLR